MYYRILFAFFLALTFSSCLNKPQTPKGIVIELYSPNLPDTTDVYIVGMPSELVTKVVIALLISNIFWAVIAKYSYPKIKEWM